MVSPSISDAEIMETISNVKSKFLSTCCDYVTSENSLSSILKNRMVQIIGPLLLIILGIYIAKPKWAMDKEEKNRKTGKIIVISVIMYVFVILALVAARTYLFPAKTDI